MFTISEHDKRVWEKYVSDFEKFVLFPKNNSLPNTQGNNKKIFSKKDKPVNNFKNFKKKKLEPDIIIDLHGYNRYSAKLLLQKFISNCYDKNKRNIFIITGKGQNNKGALKEEVPKWLSDKSFVKFLVNFNVAPRRFGGEGALLVRIKNRYKKSNY